MRTITEKLAIRLEAQADEADVQGLQKISSNLRNALKTAKTRDDAESYTYTEKDLQTDVEGPLWDAIVRIADFYNCNVDAPQLQPIVEKIASGLMKEISVKAGMKHGVGAYEPTVLGELHKTAVIEIEDEPTK